MKHRLSTSTLAAFVIAVVVVAGLSAQPDPYRRDADWAKLPDGMKWAAVIGAEQGRDGNIYVLHRCYQNSCAGRTEPPLLVFDRSGKLLRTWGSGMFIFPSAKSLADEPRYFVRSHQLSSVHTEIPALTTYLPWSPASYQPPVTSSA